MKKSLILLSVMALLTACKNQSNSSETPSGTTEQTQLESNDAADLAQNDSLTLSENTENVVSALSKNEDESYSFRFNLKQGETYPFHLKINQKQSMSAAGQSMDISSSRTVDFDYLVQEVVGNKFKLKATFKSFGESFQAPTGETIAFHTSQAKPADKDVAASWSIYKAISGQSFQMEVDNQGRVLAVNGLDKVQNNAMSQLKSQFNQEEQTYIKGLLEASLSNQAIQSQFEESLNIFPDRSLKIGEKWEDSQNINEGPVKGNNRVTRTFEGIQDGKATIKVNGVQTVSGKETKEGITATMKNDATITGTVILDLESGWLNKVNVTKKETMSTTYQQGDQKETEKGTQTIVTTVN
ncbi:MAG TPA: DUF6263 family protein [Moheibacter sp.]|nr:DUF6263 family protein [Moheibacter sp.]